MNSFSQSIEEKNMENNYLVKPKGIALVWPADLPLASDGTNRNTLIDFYKKMIDAIPEDIELTLIVKSKKIAKSIEENYNKRSVSTLVTSKVKDIWIRDWAPLNITSGSGAKALKLKYQPSYLNKGEFEGDNESGNLISDIINIDIHPNFVLDGGNFTHNGQGIGIVTNRVISDNENYSIQEIRDFFKNNFGISKLLILPVEPFDETGHIDGMLQFITSNTIAIGEYPNNFEANEFLNKVTKIIEKEISVDVLRISNGKIIESKKEGISSALGNHINFLVLGEKVLVPVYDNNDKQHVEELGKYFNKNNIIEINSTKLAQLGGVIHCITWEYYYEQNF